MSFILAYITNPDKKTAEKISKILLDKRIIACSNIFPITSMYWWKGKIENAQEYVALVKTRKENWENLKEEVKSMHPYEVPAIIKINAEADDEYEGWIDDSTLE